ncbi:uncharacterized protein [Dysidea avara]|uniref:uncharacterized protein isoform X2 n=1 Tax=Dysidea avara TaxID=196820 RepID=UPI0033245BA8
MEVIHPPPSILPLSPLIVVKAPILRERPLARRSIGNQEMLLALLNKRRKNYLARIKEHPANSTSREETKEYIETGISDPAINSLDDKKSTIDHVTSAPLFVDKASIKDFAEHVIKCAKKRHKKSRKQKSCDSRVIIPVLSKTEQKLSRTNPLRHKITGCDKLSSPMKQEIREVYRLNVSKHDADSKQADIATSPVNHSLHKTKSTTTSPTVLTSIQGPKRSPISNGAQPSCMRRLVYLSEKQSEMSPVIGVPNAPPCTPDTTEWRQYYVPSLHNIKSQRLLKSRLLEIENNVKEREAKERDREAESRKKKELEDLVKIKEQQMEIQRSEIYALNKIMTALAETRISTFISEKI